MQSAIPRMEGEDSVETLRFLMISTHYPPHHLGGDAVMVSYLSEELATRGHEVHVFYSPATYMAWRRGGSSLVRDDQKTMLHKHPFVSSLGRFNSIVAYTLGCSENAKSQLKSLIEDVRPDIVHWHNTAGFIDSPVATPGAISLLTPHDYYCVCPRSSLMRPNGVACESPRRCLLCTAKGMRPPQLWRTGCNRIISIPPELHVICPSEFLANTLRSFGVRTEKVLRNFVPDPGLDQIRFENRTNTLVFLGVLEPFKGVRTLIDAFEQCKESQGFILEIIGDGSLRKELERKVRNSKLRNRVRFRGYLQRGYWMPILRNSCRLVMPSECYENAPLSALEAFSLGVPVIGSRMGGLPEILTEESDSVLFNPGDRTSLAETLVGEWRRVLRAGPFSDKARHAYEINFSPEVFHRRYTEMIKEFGLAH